MKLRLLCFTLALVTLCQCSERQSTNQTVEDKIVHELSNRRIVLIADFYHNIALPYQTVLRVLNAWLDSIEKGTGHTRHLTLFVEDDSSVANSVRKYLKTGNMNPFLDLALPSTSMERLEFYYDLRRVAKRIDTLNSKLPPGKRITFDIQGPEFMGVFSPGILDSSAHFDIEYFVAKRDSLAALNVITYLEQHPLQKALIFYGSAHLITKTVSKYVTGSLSPEEAVGNYLAYYLKSKFGVDSVFSINQIPERQVARWFKHPINGDILLDSKDVPWGKADLANNNLSPDNFDAFVLRGEVFCPSHPLSQVFSKRILEASIARMQSIGPHPSGALAIRFYDQSLDALRFLTGDDSMNIRNAKSTKVVGRFDGFRRLDSPGFRKQLTMYYKENGDRPDKMAFLISLGFPMQLEGSPALSAPEWNSLLDRTIPQVVFLNSVGIAMIGYPSEKEEAMKYLAQYSKQSFPDPAQYLKWWRKKYYDATY